jgi:glycosyltransferase involved in cell wall biosynthesis
LNSRETSKLKTIAVDLTPVLPGGENGGAKVFVLELLRRLAELAPQTQFVLLTQPAAHGELAHLDRANVRRLMVASLDKPQLRSLATKAFSRALAYLPGRLARVAGRLGYSLLTLAKRGGSRSVLGDLKVDLLFCPFTAPIYFEPKIPTISVIYDLQYRAYPEFFAAHELVQRRHTFEDARRKSTMLVAISDFTRDSTIAAAKLDPGHIKTIHLQISQHSLRNAPQDETILDRLKLVPGRYLIYPANFWRHKNHEMLLAAFGLAHHNGLPEDVRLVCTGAPGERRDWLMRAARGLGLEDRILFPGYLANPELLALMSNSAGIIFPSLYEGFGLPVVEAMATGVPVACSNVTSLPEVAGDAAILFDPRLPENIAAAIATLIQDTELRSRLVTAGNARAARFSDSGTMAKQYWEVFEQAVRSEIQTSLISGVHSDGWLGPYASVQIAGAACPADLFLEISLPPWAPAGKVTMSVLQNGEAISKLSVGLGQNACTSLPLSPSGGLVSVELSPAFVPSLVGLGDDARELVAMLTKCEIRHSDGSLTTLFPEAASG